MKIIRPFMIIALLALSLAGCETASPGPASHSAGETADSSQPETIDDQTDLNPSPESAASTEEDIVPPEENQPEYYVDEKYFIRPVKEMDKSEKIALLTFDDSPSGVSTLAILDILDKYNAKAIWFINGYYAEKHKDLLKEIHDRGHIIGNHTWWHKNFKLDKLSPEETREEIVSINDLVEEVIGERPKFFRAPNGTYTEEAKKVIREENMQYMNWSVGSRDWELKKPEEIKEQVLATIHNGANILFHDKKITAEVLDSILKELTDQGYTFVLPTEVRVAE